MHLFMYLEEVVGMTTSLYDSGVKLLADFILELGTPEDVNALSPVIQCFSGDHLKTLMTACQQRLNELYAAQSLQSGFILDPDGQRVVAQLVDYPGDSLPDNIRRHILHKYAPGVFPAIQFAAEGKTRKLNPWELPGGMENG